MKLAVWQNLVGRRITRKAHIRNVAQESLDVEKSPEGAPPCILGPQTNHTSCLRRLSDNAGLAMVGRGKGTDWPNFTFFLQSQPVATLIAVEVV